MIVSNGSPTQCGQLLSWRKPKACHLGSINLDPPLHCTLGLGNFATVGDFLRRLAWRPFGEDAHQQS
jgi:hypothetical protein